MPESANEFSDERAARLLRAKAHELERQSKLFAERGDDRYWLIADVALIAELLANHIENKDRHFDD
jgi:hypothetical protein